MNDVKQQSKPLRRTKPLKDAVAGACAGAAGKTIMAPIERVKLLMQLQGSVQGIQGQNIWTVTTQVYREEGFLAFWRGNLPNVLRTAGQAGLNFALMDHYKHLAQSSFVEKTVVQRRTSTTEDMQRRRSRVISFISGGLAGGTSTTVLYPVEFLRTRLAVDEIRPEQGRKFRGMKDVIVHTFRHDGIVGLYQGYVSALWGSVLYRLLYLGGYDALKMELERYKDVDEPITVVERFSIAQAVSLTAGTICYPIDSVRRRLMMQAGKPFEERLYHGSLHCFRVVWRQEGTRGFFLGLTPNLIRSIGGALMLVCYDVIKAVL